MSTRYHCDGCGEVSFAEETGVDAPAITGERTDGWCGAELPDGRFHWCRACALIAFRALRAARGKK